MRQQSTASAEMLGISRAGVLFVSGFVTSLRIERGALVVRSGSGRDIQDRIFPKMHRPRMRRLVVFGKGGYTTWDALAWVDGIGASFIHLSRSGRIIAASGERSGDQPALRRAQAHATESEAGLEAVRYLLGTKIEGQLQILEQDFANDWLSIDAVKTAAERIRKSGSAREALAWEARAAAAYWKAWDSLPMLFSRSDISKTPEHWRLFSDRHSPLSGSPRNAANPACAVLNFLYSLAEFECRLALLSVGLDPGLGWAHRDAPYRDSAALDLLEAMRPVVDRHVLDLLAERAFSRREFVELPTGQVRLVPGLAKSLAESTLASFETVVAPFADHVARLMADAASTPVRLPSRNTRGAAGRGRGTLGRGSPPSNARPKRIPSACRECGVVLDRDDRAYCPDCLPGFKAERTAKLVRAAKQTLATMRSSEEDPAQTPEAKAKRSAAVSERARLAREWNRENPGPYDREEFVREVLPGLARVTLPAMVNATGLTSGYCFKIKRGERTPHPMYWAVLRAIANN